MLHFTDEKVPLWSTETWPVSQHEQRNRGGTQTRLHFHTLLTPSKEAWRTAATSCDLGWVLWTRGLKVIAWVWALVLI